MKNVSEDDELLLGSYLMEPDDVFGLHPTRALQPN